MVKNSFPKEATFKLSLEDEQEISLRKRTVGLPSRENGGAWLVKDSERTVKARMAREQMDRARQEKPNMLCLLSGVPDPVNTGRH